MYTFYTKIFKTLQVSMTVLLSAFLFFFFFLHFTGNIYSKFTAAKQHRSKLDDLFWRSSRRFFSTITKTCLYNFDPLKPLFYVVKQVYRGWGVVYIIFSFLLKNIDCVYSLEPPHWGSSNKYPQSMFWAEIWKISEFFIWNFSFLVVKFSVYLNRHVFVM